MMLCAGTIAKEGTLDAEDEEGKQKKDDSSSTSSGTLDYIHLGDDVETARIPSDPSASLLPEDSNRIPDEQQTNDDHDFLLSDLSWEGDTNDFEEDDDSCSDCSSIDGFSDAEQVDDVVPSMSNPTVILLINNDEDSLDDPLSWSWYSQDQDDS